MLRRLCLLLIAMTAIASCGTRSTLYEPDVQRPPPVGPLGLSLTDETLFQDCNVDPMADGVRFSGTLRVAVPLSASEPLTPADAAEVLGEDGTVLARFELEPFALHEPDDAVTVTNRGGTLEPRGGCQLCSMPVRVRIVVRTTNLLAPTQSVESGRLSARCTR